MLANGHNLGAQGQTHVTRMAGLGVRRSGYRTLCAVQGEPRRVDYAGIDDGWIRWRVG